LGKIKTQTKKKEVRGLTEEMKVGWMKNILFLFLLLLLFVLLLRPLLPVRVYEVYGDSMLPTLKEGDQIKTKADLSFSRYDIVVADIPQEGYVVKRIIGLPEEEIEITTQGIVLIDGLSLTQLESFQNEPIQNAKPLKFVLQKGEYFLMGDNPNHSKDSRDFGPVKENSLLGIVE